MATTHDQNGLYSGSKENFRWDNCKALILPSCLFCRLKTTSQTVDLVNQFQFTFVLLVFLFERNRICTMRFDYARGLSKSSEVILRDENMQMNELFVQCAARFAIIDIVFNCHISFIVSFLKILNQSNYLVLFYLIVFDRFL